MSYRITFYNHPQATELSVWTKSYLTYESAKRAAAQLQHHYPKWREINIEFEQITKTFTEDEARIMFYAIENYFRLNLSIDKKYNTFKSAFTKERAANTLRLAKVFAPHPSAMKMMQDLYDEYYEKKYYEKKEDKK